MNKTRWLAIAAPVAVVLGLGLAVAPAASAETTSDPIVVNGLTVLTRDCKGSTLDAHTGFQIAPACVSTAMGEVAAAAKDPTLLIVDAPDKVDAGEGFTIKVSTKNLVRDRFLGAAAGGYYLESSVLTKDGLQRGHFHVACRTLVNGDNVAPGNPEAVPEFFQAVEDGGGSTTADTVAVAVSGKNAAGKNRFSKGEVQCSAWAGDGSHRTPQMQRANQTPAFDSVRIKIQHDNNGHDHHDGRHGDHDD